MTAEEARILTGTGIPMKRYISIIDEAIEVKAKRGERCVEVHTLSQYTIPTSYYTDLQVYYSGLGYDVSHYTAPWQELHIKW